MLQLTIRRIASKRLAMLIIQNLWMLWTANRWLISDSMMAGNAIATQEQDRVCRANGALYFRAVSTVSTDTQISGPCLQCRQTPNFQDRVNTVNRGLILRVGQRAVFITFTASLFRQLQKALTRDFPYSSVSVTSRFFQERNIVGVQKKGICNWKWPGIYHIGARFEQTAFAPHFSTRCQPTRASQDQKRPPDRIGR